MFDAKLYNGSRFISHRSVVFIIGCCDCRLLNRSFSGFVIRYSQ